MNPKQSARVRIPASQRVHRILKGSPAFLPPGLRFGRPFPKGVLLHPDDECLGGIWGSSLEAILTARGAYLRAASGWKFVAYAEIENVFFPEKDDSNGALKLQTPHGVFELLSTKPELWTVGRYFLRCAADAK